MAADRLLVVALFVETPHNTLSYVWRITGCQHTLQPTDNDFAPPSVPALTLRGFSRWESLEILLGPEEHVPFLQYAVKNWSLKHPDTGELFPPDLPASVFPAEADAAVDRWHKHCAQQLKLDSTPGEEEQPSRSEASPYQHDSSSSHSRGRDQPRTSPPRRRAAEGGYFPRQPIYTHVPPRQQEGHGARASHRPGRKPRHESPPRERERMRRRSLPDYSSPTEPSRDTFPPDDFVESAAPRRVPQFSRQNYARPEVVSDDSEDEPIHRSAKPKRRHYPEDRPAPSIRRFVPPRPSIDITEASPTSSSRPHRAELRQSDQKQRLGSTSSPVDSLRSKFTEAVSRIVPGVAAPERPRGGSRQNSHNEPPPARSRRSREQDPAPRLSRSHSDMDSEELSEPETSEDELRRRRRLRQDRERERERERDRARDRGRYREPDVQFEREQERPYLRRPDNYRRTSSHADIDRRRDHPLWGEIRDPERGRDERKRWDDRDERNLSPMTGVTNRRYPEPAYS
jgi:hypothetical protein